MKTKLLFLTVLLAACVSTTNAQTLLFKDDFSDPKLNGWIQLGVPAVLTNVQQQVLISANCGRLDTNNFFATHFAWGHAIPMPGELTNGWTLEARADLVSANQNDAWASMHFLWDPYGGSGYVFLVDRDEAALAKFWNGIGSLAWFFYEPCEIKNQNVTLVLTLTRRDTNLVINTRVLDKDNANAVVFERTKTDTPQADPTLPNRSVKGTPSVKDMVGEAWRLVRGPGYVEVTLDWTNPESGPTGPAQVVYDNMEVWLYESPQLAIQNAVVLSWPLTQGQFVLESASSANGPWTPVLDPWSRTNAGQAEVSVLASDPVNLFRLRFSP